MSIVQHTLARTVKKYVTLYGNTFLTGKPFFDARLQRTRQRVTFFYREEHLLLEFSYVDSEVINDENLSQ